METTADFYKLLELRAKTDRQLIALVNRRLNAALDAARHVSTAANCPADVSGGYREARTLMPWIEGLTEAERTRLECRLNQLRGLLDSGFSSDASLRMQTACS